MKYVFDKNKCRDLVNKTVFGDLDLYDVVYEDDRISVFQSGYLLNNRDGRLVFEITAMTYGKKDVECDFNVKDRNEFTEQILTSREIVELGKLMTKIIEEALDGNEEE